MAQGTYSYTEKSLDSLLKSYNSVIGNGDTLGVNAQQAINLRLFNNNTTISIPGQYNYLNGPTDSASVGAGSNLYLEYGNNGSGTLDFTTAAHHTVIVLGGDDAVNFNDLGQSANAGDRGDTIIGGNVAQSIQTNSGKNLVVAGGGQDTIIGGGSKDTLIGGGNTWVQATGSGSDKLYGGLAGSAHDTLDASNSSGNDKLVSFQGSNTLIAGSGFDTLLAGSGNDVLTGGQGQVSMVGGGLTSMTAGAGAATMMGGFSVTSMDTLVGGQGADFIKVKHGDNVIVAGSGNDTIKSFDKGTGGGSGGDMISLTGGGNAVVNILGGPATDTVTFGGTTGSDTINAAGSVEIQVQNTEHLTHIDSSGGVTTLQFQDGQTLTYSGSGHVTLTFQ
jgi:Ca2+-binding RTX toxin-like protein